MHKIKDKPSRNKVYYHKKIQRKPKPIPDSISGSRISAFLQNRKERMSIVFPPLSETTHKARDRFSNNFYHRPANILVFNMGREDCLGATSNRSHAFCLVAFVVASFRTLTIAHFGDPLSLSPSERERDLAGRSSIVHMARFIWRR